MVGIYKTLVQTSVFSIVTTMFCLTVSLSLCVWLVSSQGDLNTIDDLDHYHTLYKEFRNTYRQDNIELSDITDINLIKDDYRFNIFVKNVKRAEKLQKEDQGTAEYGVNQFSDFTETEFQNQYLGLNTEQSLKSDSLGAAKIPNIVIPKHFDWREKNAVTHVKNQGLCGCCWAFCAVANIESIYAIKYKNLVTFSEQELVDCDYFNNGCDGGLMTNAFATVKQRGLVMDSIYPYEGINTTCRLDKDSRKIKIKGYVELGPNEDDMAKYVYMNSPISIGINSSAIQFYQKGIAHPTVTNCNHSPLDHAMLIIGFGEEDNIPYWLAKNSWSTEWGDKGFIKIYRGEGVCGLNRLVSSPLL